MSFLDSLFGSSSGPSERQVRSAVSALETRHGEPIRRYEAADKLAGWGTPAALSGLLRRYTFNAPAEMSDEEEKAHVAELLVTAGEKAVGPIEGYLLSEAEVAWPLRVLERILGPERFRDRATAVAARLDTHFDRIPTRKVDLLHALQPHAADAKVADTTARFLDDTDDTVRLAAIDLLAASGRDADRRALLASLPDCGDRPRVLDALLGVLADKEWLLEDARAALEPMLPKDYYISREGFVRRMAKPGRA